MPKQQKSRRRKSKSRSPVKKSGALSLQAPRQAPQQAPPQARSLRSFLGLVLLWLAPVFALWYALGPVLLIPVAWLSDSILSGLYPHAIEAVELQGRALDIVTRFNYAPPGIELPSGKIAQFIMPLNAMKYGYGLPLLLTLILASPNPLLAKFKHFILGFAMIVLVQVWGICFESLINLIFKVDQSIALQMGSTAFSREALALGYQLGYLILPAVTPLIYWGLSHYSFLQTLLAVPASDKTIE